MNNTSQQLSEDSLDLELELDLDSLEQSTQVPEVDGASIAELEGDEFFASTEPGEPPSAPEALSSELVAALPRSAEIDKLSILVAHEDRTAVGKLKSILASLDLVLQLHRVTSIDDLKDSLQAQEWDIVCCMDGSSEFTLQAVSVCVQESGREAAALFVYEEAQEEQLNEILGCGFADSIPANAPLKVVNAFLREAVAVKHRRQVRFHEDLLDEANQKTALLLDASADAIAYVADGMIMHGNQALISLLGVEAIDELTWQSFIDFVAEHDQQSVKQLLRRFNKDPDGQANCTASLINEQQEEVPVALTLASASHEGEACIQVLLRTQEDPTASGEQMISQAEPASITVELETEETPTDVQTTNEVSAEQNSGLLGFSSANALLETVEKIELLSEVEPKGHILVMHVSTDRLLDTFDALHPYGSAIDSLSDFVDQIANELLMPGIRFTSSDWILLLPESTGADIAGYVNSKLQELGRTLSIDGLDASNAISIGSAQYGIADIDPANALAKAFCACAEQKSIGGGFKQYAHRISDKGSSNTLMTAMELDRLSIRYQPVIGLQNQPIHLYEASLYLKEDDGTEKSASEAMRALGVEIENTQLDHWFFNKLLESLKTAYQQDRQICVSATITASAIVNNNFFPDLMSTFERSGLPKSCMSFSADVGFAEDYLEKTKKLYSLLRQAGFNTTLYGVSENHIPLLNEIKPSFAALNIDISDDEQEPWQQGMKRMFEAARLSKTDCIVGEVSSAADLAKIWQCGAPFIRGSYLQEPMTSLDYEFSDIG